LSFTILFEAPPIFQKIFTKHPEKAEELMKRFPDAFGREESECNGCTAGNCKKRISYVFNGKAHQSCGGRESNKNVKPAFVFENPSLEDVKFLLELYKLENNIKPL
jgi:hypothetical protein